MHVETDELISALRGSGLRMTEVRSAICKVLAESHDEHIDAADLHDRTGRLLGRRIDLSTVYRTVDTLEELGFLHHVHMGHGPGIIHLSEASDHHHLVCDLCGRTVNIPLTEVGDAFGRLANGHGFEMSAVHFALVGRCSVCRDRSR